MQSMKEIEIIQQFEDIFIEAGKLAVKLRKDAVIEKKHNSGIEDIDIVTSADLAVQEFVLGKLAVSELKHCEIVAEEDTSSKNLFAKFSDLVITIDPIDGTKLYASGKKMYSIIITIHNKKRPIYTFCYFPEVKWGIKIVYDQCQFFGDKPEIMHNSVLPNTIVYSFYSSKGHPIDCIPERSRKLLKDNYVFRNKKEITNEAGSTALFLLGIVDGYFVENGSAVDCLVAFHYALARGFEIYQNIDLTKTVSSKISDGNDEYRGNYLVIRNK